MRKLPGQLTEGEHPGQKPNVELCTIDMSLEPFFPSEPQHLHDKNSNNKQGKKHQCPGVFSTGDVLITQETPNVFIPNHCNNLSVERPPGHDSRRGTALLQLNAGPHYW